MKKKLLLLSAVLITGNIYANDRIIQDGVIGAIVGGIIGNNIGEGDAKSGAIIGALSGMIIGDTSRNQRNQNLKHKSSCKQKSPNYHKIQFARNKVWIPAYTRYSQCGEILDIVPGKWHKIN